jgi:hypothetical protein
MPPKKAREQEEEPIGRRTRQSEFYYTRQALSSRICGLSQDDRAGFDAKIVAKNLNDCFLPHWNTTSLKNRLGFTAEQASLFLTAVTDLQREGVVPKSNSPTAADYDAVVANVVMGDHGQQQFHIDAYVRSNGVLCQNSTVSRRCEQQRAGGAERSPRRRNISQASINMISDLLFAATAATDCKPVNSARRFVRAFAMLERRFGSAAEYLQRNRQLPLDQIFVQGSQSRSRVALHYPADAVFNPQHPSFGYAGVDSQAAAAAVRESPLSATQTQVSESTQAATQTQDQASDNDEGGGSDGGDDDDQHNQSPDSDNSDSQEDGDDDEADEDSDAEEVDRTLAPLVWNGPLPRDAPDNKLSMRYPRKTQLAKLFKDNGWHSYKGQWVEKHRRQGADPETIKMYLDETDKCKLRNDITIETELNGDETLFKGEVTDALRHSKFLVVRGPRAIGAEIRNKHAWTTKEGTPDKIALVGFPVISRLKCHLLQIILKGNPNPRSPKQKQKQRDLADEVRRAYPPQLQHLIYVVFTASGYQTAESFKDVGRALIVALFKEESPASTAWMNIATTPLSDIKTRLKNKFLFKFDGSSTHCLNDNRVLVEWRSRGLIPWPYTPNATAFLQELDQLCFWIFKNSARRIMKLEIEFEQEKSDLANLFMRMTWMDDVMHAYRAELDEHSAELTPERRSGHKGFDKYECRPDALAMLNDLCNRKGMAWDAVRLAKMLGWSLGQALLTPSILAQSFEAVTRENVFRRPLVAREMQLHGQRRVLEEKKLVAMSELVVAMAGGNAASLSLPESARLPSAVVIESIADDKWQVFETKVLRCESNPDIRQMCTLFNSFSIGWEASAKNQEKRERFLEMYNRNDDEAALLAAADADDANARAELVSGFMTWLETQSLSVVSMDTKLENLTQVALPSAETLLTALQSDSAALNAQSSKKERLNVQKQGVAVTRAVNAITSALDDVAGRASKLLINVQTRKLKSFPNAASPAPETPGFAAAHGALMQRITALRSAISAFKLRDTYVRPPAPAVTAAADAQPVAEDRGRGGGAGRGRGGRGSRGGRGRGRGAGSEQPQLLEPSPPRQGVLDPVDSQPDASAAVQAVAIEGAGEPAPEQDVADDEAEVRDIVAIHAQRLAAAAAHSAQVAANLAAIMED